MAEVVAVSGLLTQWMDRLEFEQYTSFWLDMSDEELRTSVRIRPSARPSVVHRGHDGRMTDGRTDGRTDARA